MKYLLTLLLFVPLYAGLINAVALTVNEEAVTLYEIDTYATQFNLSKTQAAVELIKKIITKQVAKEKSIFVEQAQIEAQIEEIQLKNGLTKEAFDQQLALQGLTRTTLFEQFEYQQLQQRLIGILTYGKITEPTIEEQRTFFTQNQERFALPKKITIIEYRSPNESSLASIKRSPLFSPPDVFLEEKTIDPVKINPQLLQLLLATKERTFTDVLPFGTQGFGMFYVKKIGEKEVPTFKEVQAQLAPMIQAEKRNTIINNFFSDEMRKAKIHYLRIAPLTLEL